MKNVKKNCLFLAHILKKKATVCYDLFFGHCKTISVFLSRFSSAWFYQNARPEW